MSVACQNLLLSSLTAYYQKRPLHRKVLYDIVEGLSPLSLRIIDWFVTHYARSHHVLYWIDEASDQLVETYPEKGGGTHLKKYHLYLEYRAQLKSYTKMFFDPFRRHERITFVLETTPLKVLETTVGQLNFFRWALQHHVLEYIMNHLAEIEEHMAKFQKAVKLGQDPKPPKESIARTTNTVMRAPCHLSFD
jgi:hypothetical protein